MKQINKDLLECFSTTVGATIMLTCLAFFGHGDVGLLHLDDCCLFSGLCQNPAVIFERNSASLTSLS